MGAVTNGRQADMILDWLRRVGPVADTDVTASNLGRGAARTWGEMKVAGMIVRSGTRLYPLPEAPTWAVA